MRPLSTETELQADDDDDLTTAMEAYRGFWGNPKAPHQTLEEVRAALFAAIEAYASRQVAQKLAEHTVKAYNELGKDTKRTAVSEALDDIQDLLATPGVTCSTLFVAVANLVKPMEARLLVQEAVIKAADALRAECGMPAAMAIRDGVPVIKTTYDYDVARGKLP